MTGCRCGYCSGRMISFCEIAAQILSLIVWSLGAIVAIQFVEWLAR